MGVALRRSWRDLPERYGPYTTCYNRFNRWRKNGVWDRLMDAIVEAYDGEIQMIDSSSVRVHQHAAGSKRGSGSLHGSFRGGLTTKIHTVVDATGLPLRFALSPGQATTAPLPELCSTIACRPTASCSPTRPTTRNGSGR